MICDFGLRSWQTISYMAERIVGQGSFGTVFQVTRVVLYICCILKLSYFIVLEPFDNESN